jgi:BirA family biotin operon repressor/biotin-[acetyl-CoA-carboxylase] ligase
MSVPFVRTVVHREVLESTSDLARRLAVEGECALPLVVRADRQTRGRGRGNHTWWSDAGSLTWTLVLDPAAHGLRPEHEPRLALATAVAIIEAIGPLGLRETPGIRWPNDVELGGRKLGGILPERVETERGARLAIGIGLNVTTDLDRAPAEVRRMAASLSELSPRALGPASATDLLDAVHAQLATIVNQLAANDPTLAERWAELDTLRDRPVRVDLGPRIVSGTGGGIDREGALYVITEAGAVRLFGGQVLRDI